MAQSGALIFLHGLGDTEQGWMALSGMLRQRAPHLRYVTATAPVMPVTVNMGMRMTSWFDMDAIPVLPETVDDKASIESVGMRALSGLIGACARPPSSSPAPHALPFCRARARCARGAPLTPERSIRAGAHARARTPRRVQTRPSRAASHPSESSWAASRRAAAWPCRQHSHTPRRSAAC